MIQVKNGKETTALETNVNSTLQLLTINRLYEQRFTVFQSHLYIAAPQIWYDAYKYFLSTTERLQDPSKISMAPGYSQYFGIQF